jgi:23S rRNA (adenine2503-C2)-methyltransferase
VSELSFHTSTKNLNHRYFCHRGSLPRSIFRASTASASVAGTGSVCSHAATQPGRAALVPVATKWPLDELLPSCRTYSETTGRRIFYEWTLIEGKNDSPEDARAVGRLLRGLPAQVNLIRLNPTTGYAGTPTHSAAAKNFKHILAEEFKLPSTVRQRRSIDIAAGCGQLAIG